jgi:hypothetical protein
VKIFAAHGAPLVSLTPVRQMEKTFNHKSFNYFVCTFWEVELTYRYILPSSSLKGLSSLLLFPFFATSVIDTGGINNTSEIGGKICRQCR